MSKSKLGILVGGGPAPGINGVIGAATIKAINSGLEVIGLYDGFKWLCRGDASHVVPLRIEDVSRIHLQGGSILRTARDNPTKSPELMPKALGALEQLDLDYLVTIGGDDTATSASNIAARMGDSLRVAHVPKTIDNDLPLPGDMPTFGFQTARHVGAGLVQNLMEDARTTGRWYLVVAMGRKAGHLALGIGRSAGATLSLIPEEFPPGTLTLDQVCNVIEGAIIKRRAMGRSDGTVVLAEGIGERLDPEELKDIPGVEVSYDEHNHLQLREIPLARILKSQVEQRFKQRGDKLTLVSVDLGYELRCAPPIPFDCEYVRNLGWGAVSYLLGDQYDGSALVCLEDGRISPLHFETLIDPQTNHARVRMVDVSRESYRIAREYMIRLIPDDLNDPQQVANLAKAAKMTPDEFRRKFAQLV
jgi:ATP-dependent phosphofructokinase / diphosphate-dependent phosphofructokinase